MDQFEAEKAIEPVRWQEWFSLAERFCLPCGALAQLGERLICIQEVIGSIPIGSTKFCAASAVRVARPDFTPLGSVAQVVRAHA